MEKSSHYLPRELESLPAEDLILLAKKLERELEEKDQMISFLRRELTETSSQFRAMVNHFTLKKRFDC